jgi:signal transduction histidine kinase
MAGFADVVRIPPPHRVATNVGELVQRIAALLRPELESRHIALTVDLPTDFTVVLDPHQFEQVILNVLRNAIESLHHDGSVTITLRDRTLTIADSGPGIAEEARPELFTPFFTTKPEGRGLGLTIVGEILTNHGLTYTLRNRTGGGAEFVIEL